MWQWWLIGILGIFVLSFFLWLIYFRKQKFDVSLLGLLTLGITLIIGALLQPPSIKYGDVEMIIDDAKKATKEAEKASLLVNETVAMLLWNHGRLGVRADTNAARKLLEKVHGKEKAQGIIDYFIDKDIFKTSGEEKRNLLRNKGAIKIPENTISPLIEMIDKNE